MNSSGLHIPTCLLQLLRTFDVALHKNDRLCFLPVRCIPGSSCFLSTQEVLDICTQHLFEKACSESVVSKT